MTTGPCAKQTVTATIVTEDNQTFVGTNGVFTPQYVCPRGGLPSGVGYELCRSVCAQPVHAEVAALVKAGEAARGATLYLEGHTFVCPDCQIMCDAAGIKEIIIGSPVPCSSPTTAQHG